MDRLENYYISDMYYKPPNEIVFREDYTDFNPPHDESTYESIKELIISLGQQKPILMLEGRCIDGRHRTQITTELGTQVMCVDMEPGTDPKKLILLANLDSMGSRSYSPTQNAINAYKLSKDYGFKQVEAAKLCGIAPKQVTFVKSLVKYGYPKVIHELEKGNKVMIADMESGSHSLEYLCKIAKVSYEKDKVTVDNSNRIQFDPEAAIKTEAGKAWYYDKVNSLELNRDTAYNSIKRQDYAELANYKFINTDEDNT